MIAMLVLLTLAIPTRLTVALVPMKKLYAKITTLALMTTVILAPDVFTKIYLINVLLLTNVTKLLAMKKRVAS